MVDRKVRKNRPKVPTNTVHTGVTRVDLLSGESESPEGVWIRWGSSVALYMGVGLLALFIYWTAHLGMGVGSVTQVATANAVTQELELPHEIAPLNVDRWRNRLAVKSRRSLRSGNGQGSALVNKVVPEMVHVGGEAIAMPTEHRQVLSGGAAARDVRFFGLRIEQDVKSVVFVIDASGSMADTLPFVVRELAGSLRALNEQTEYSVIFFTNGGAVLEVPPGGLKLATDRNKQAAIRWIQTESGHVVAGGQTNPIKAFEKAFSYRPEVIQVLSDNITGRGRWEVQQSILLNEVIKMNQDGVRIDTLQFLYKDPLSHSGGKGTLWKLSQLTGGTYKFVDGRELGIAK